MNGKLSGNCYVWEFSKEDENCKTLHGWYEEGEYKEPLTATSWEYDDFYFLEYKDKFENMKKLLKK